MRVFAAVAAIVIGCGAPSAPSPSPSVTSLANASPSAPVSPIATSTLPPVPSIRRGTAQVPQLTQMYLFPQVRFDIVAVSYAGQPAEDIQWQTEPYRADAAYMARAATTFGMSGTPYLSAQPGGAAPWRMWIGDGLLAVNDATGEVLFLADDRVDGPATPGPAQRDPAAEVERIARALGSPVDITPTPGYFPAFRTTDSAARFGALTDWHPSPDRQSAFIFPRSAAPLSQVVTIYDPDEVGVLTSKFRVAAFMHHPLGTLRDPAIYPITTYAQALAELKKDPGRYLRLLNGPGDDFLTLSINPATVVLGHAWAAVRQGALRRGGHALVPAWVFPASGTATDGTRVDALFLVDAVVPEVRAPQTFGPVAFDADSLLRQQLIGGRGYEPAVVARDFLGQGCSGLRLDPIDANTFAGSSTCVGRGRVDFKISKAFPGYDRSTWYVSDPQR